MTCLIPVLSFPLDRNSILSNNCRMNKIGRNSPCPCGSGKKTKNVVKAGTKKAKQQAPKAANEIAKDVSKTKKMTPSKSKAESFGDIAKKKVRETAALAKEAQSIPGITIKESGKILFCEETATIAYADELTKFSSSR